ncbi:MAG: DUF4129 domain-containing protein [Haloplanus sp.]
MPAARSVAVAALAVLAIGAAAATLPSAVPIEGSGDAGGGGGDTGGGLLGQPGGLLGLDAENRGRGAAAPTALPCVPFLNDPRFLAAVAAVALVGVALTYRRGGPLLPVALIGGLAPIAVVVHAALTACAAAGSFAGGLPSRVRRNASAAVGLTGSGGGGGGTATSLPAESTAILGALGLALVVAAALLVRATGDDDPGDAPAGESDAPSTAAIGRAAGRAADRIEHDVPADNAVYRAWREMTDHLDVADPATSTPAEFAEAAVAAGMAPADVDELTALFEDVRYGGRDPTDDREERAVDALRRIEAAYGEDAG